jgi:hypothetical protein
VPYFAPYERFPDVGRGATSAKPVPVPVPAPAVRGRPATGHLAITSAGETA